MCRGIGHSFEVSKDYVLRGLRSKDMALYAVGRVHAGEEELLSDLSNWERMRALHSPATASKYAAPKLATATPACQIPKKKTDESGRWKKVDKTAVVSSGTREDASPACCWVCKKTGHVSRDCPDKLKRKLVCFGCGVEGHIRPNCPEKDQTNVAETRPVSLSHPYKKVGLVDGREVEVLLDTGSHHSLIKASVALRCGLHVRPSCRPLYGIGSTTVPSVNAVGEIEADVVLDGVNPGKVLLLVVPDAVQAPDVIVGRSWLDLPLVAYHKAHGRLYIYAAESSDSSSPVGVTSYDKEADYLHAVEVNRDPPVRQPLELSDFEFVNTEVAPEERGNLLTLVNEFRDCFAKSLDELGCTPMMKVDIKEVPGSFPVVCRPYKTTQADREEIHKIVSDWKRCGVVSETTSPYASPVLLVKQAGKSRLCVDYRRLNKQTVRQHYPLPDMMEQLESLADSKLFAQLDLASGYLQIPLTKEASQKTAFITADTTGEFNRMPFGLSGAVAEFTRLMQRVLGPLRGLYVRNYLDDMVVDGKDWAEMLLNLRAVLGRIREAQLTLKPSKCSFGAKRIQFLGFIVENGEIRPGAEKVSAIEEYPVPKDQHEVRRFLGLTGFFRRFVEKYAVVAEPLTRLMRGKQEFKWSEEQQTAFDSLRRALTGDTVQTMFRKEAAVTELHTDASALGLGAMLLQSSEEGGPLRLVFCASRKTSDAETRYHSSKLELLCVVWAINKLRQYLLGIRFTVYTDCQALTYLNSGKNVNSQLARWYDSLQEYEFDVKYRPGVRMAHVDALSRAPVGEEESLDEALMERQTVCQVISQDERVMMCQTADAEVSHIKKMVEESPTEGLGTSYVVKNLLLYRRYQDKLLFVMPKSMRKSLVVTAHDLSGHPAVDRTMANVLQDFWFPDMRRYVKLHIRSCFECLLTRVPRGKRPGLLHSIPVGKRPFDTVHMDHVGPFVTAPGGFRYILVLVDNLTKYVSLYAVTDTRTRPLINCVEQFVKEYGLPGRFITDRGTCYTSGTFEQFCASQGIKLVWTSSRHPQANGQVERTHSVVMATLMTMGGAEDQWAELLPEVQRLLNNSETKVTGKTPFEMLHGYRPRFLQGALRALSATEDDWTPPAELQARVRENMERIRDRRKAAYDLHRHDNTHYAVGEVVVMRRAPNSTGESTKLQDKYRGPLVVTEVLSSDVYRVAELDACKKSRLATTAHVSQLKSWRLPVDDEAEGELEEPERGQPETEDQDPPEPQIPEVPETEDQEPPEPQIPEVPEAEGRRSQRVIRRPGWLRDYSW